MLVLDIVRKQDKLYFIADCFAALMVYDFTTGKTEICGRFENYKLFEDSVCSKLHLYGDHIYCAPGRGNTFYDYNIATNEIKIIKTNSKYDQVVKHDLTWYHQDYEVNGKIYFVGFICRDIVEIDPVDNSFTVWDLRDSEEIEANKILRQSVQGIVNGEEIIFPEMGRSLLVNFNVKTKKITRKKYESGLNPLGLFEVRGERYIFTFNGMLILTEDLKKRIAIPEEYEKIPELRGVYKAFVCDDRCILLPFRGGKVLQFSQGDLEAKVICDVADLYVDRTFFAGGWLDENTIWASSMNATSMVTIDKNNFTRSSMTIPNPENLDEFIIKEDLKGILMFESASGHDVKDYLNFLSKV